MHGFCLSKAKNCALGFDFFFKDPSILSLFCAHEHGPFACVSRAYLLQYYTAQQDDSSKYASRVYFELNNLLNLVSKIHDITSCDIYSEIDEIVTITTNCRDALNDLNQQQFLNKEDQDLIRNVFIDFSNVFTFLNSIEWVKELCLGEIKSILEQATQDLCRLNLQTICGIQRSMFPDTDLGGGC